MTYSNNKDLVVKMYQAYSESNREMIELLIAETFEFFSPLDNGINRETYFERCWPNHKRISNFHFLHFFEKENIVFVTYEGQTIKNEKFRNCEIITFENKKIIKVEVYFGWNLPHKAQKGQFIEPESL